jgi:hypothetical protein
VPALLTKVVPFHRSFLDREIRKKQFLTTFFKSLLGTPEEALLTERKANDEEQEWP